MDSSSDKDQRRRARLQTLLQRDFAGSTRALAHKLGKNAQLVARIAQPSAGQHTERFSDEWVRAIERAFPWPAGWLESDEPLPGAHALRRANLSRWMQAVTLKPEEQAVLIPLLASGDFSEPLARNIERRHSMGMGYLDRVHPLGAGAPPGHGDGGDANGAGGHGPHADGRASGAVFAHARNGKGGAGWLDLLTLPEQMQHAFLAYEENNPVARGIMQELADLLELDMTVLSRKIQAIKARQQEQ